MSTFLYFLTNSETFHDLFFIFQPAFKLCWMTANQNIRNYCFALFIMIFMLSIFTLIALKITLMPTFSRSIALFKASHFIMTSRIFYWNMIIVTETLANVTARHFWVANKFAASLGTFFEILIILNKSFIFMILTTCRYFII